MNGIIKMINAERRYGFITGSDGKKYFFHSSGLRNMAFDDLVEGARVEFEDRDTDKGPRAEAIYVEKA